MAKDDKLNKVLIWITVAIIIATVITFLVMTIIIVKGEYNNDTRKCNCECCIDKK